jgi:hypothetical protein
MNDSHVACGADDERLVGTITQAQAVLQLAVHEAVEAGLKVTVTVESMHKVGEHYPEPLLEVGVERVIKLI